MHRRKVTFKLYPTAVQKEFLRRSTALHCELYNAALEERIDCYRKTGRGVSYYEQQNALPAIKVTRPELHALGSHALQQTLRKLDLAFEAFFRRVKTGQTPGFPRFKSASRFSGFTFPDPAGWKLRQCGKRSVNIRIGEHWIRARGEHRFGDAIVHNDLTITRRGSTWWATVTLRVPDQQCARQRAGNEQIGLDFGLTAWATTHTGEEVNNPRWLREQLRELACLQRSRARKKRGSLRWRRLSKQIARLHESIGNRRRDFLHKQTSGLVTRAELIATEELQIKNMSRSARGSLEYPGKRVRQKAGLNREIVSAGIATAHQMLRYKAAEAGTRVHFANTRQLKPSQRCSQCWNLQPMPLAKRTYRCACGNEMPRDANSAVVVLIDALEYPAAEKPVPATFTRPGRGVAARLKPLSGQPVKPESTTRESPTTRRAGL